MIVEDFSEGNSIIHLLDPRVKLSVTLLLSFIIVLSDRFIVIGLGLILGVLLIFLSRPNIKKVLKRLSFIYSFIILLWVFLPFSLNGKVLYGIGKLSISYEGFFYALSITLKSTAVFLFMISLLSTSSLYSLFHAMNHLHFPKKLIYLLFFCYRYVHVMHREYMRIKNAMKVRGFRPKTNIHTYKVLSYLIGILLVRGFDHSERIYKAMLCRGFTDEFPMLYHFILKKRDLIFLSILSIFMVSLVWIQWIEKIF